MTLILLFGLAGLFLLARVTILPRLLSPPAEIAVDFTTLQRPDSPNTFLVCPPGLCRTQADLPAPEYPFGVDRLRDLWDRAVAERPRMRRISTGPDGADYVDRSLVFAFPDPVSVRFMTLGSDRSTLAIYSRSVYGRGDLGVNAARVRSLLAAIDRMRQG